MKTLAGISRRLLTVTLFIGCSVVVCSGISKRAFCTKSCNTKESVKERIENVQPSQLVSIRIMQLL